MDKIIKSYRKTQNRKKKIKDCKNLTKEQRKELNNVFDNFTFTYDSMCEIYDITCSKEHYDLVISLDKKAINIYELLGTIKIGGDLKDICFKIFTIDINNTNENKIQVRFSFFTNNEKELLNDYLKNYMAECTYRIKNYNRLKDWKYETENISFLDLSIIKKIDEIYYHSKGHIKCSTPEIILQSNSLYNIENENDNKYYYIVFPNCGWTSIKTIKNLKEEFPNYIENEIIIFNDNLRFLRLKIKKPSANKKRKNDNTFYNRNNKADLISTEKNKKKKK